MKNFRIGTRLALGFGVLLVFLGGMSWFQLAKLRDVADSIELLASNRWPKIQMSYEALVDAERNVGQVQALFLARDRAEQDRILRDIDEKKRAISAVLDKLEPMIVNPRGKELFSKVKETRGAYREAYTEIGALLLQGKRDDAYERFSKVLPQRVLASREAWEAFVKFQARYVEEAAQDGLRLYQSARTLSLAILALVALLTIAVGFYVTRSITRPVQGVVEVAQRIAAGDLRHTVQVTSRD